MLWPKRSVFLSREIGSRVVFVRPSQPPTNWLFSHQGIWLSRCCQWNVPFVWDFQRLANPHVAVVGVTGSGKSFLVKTFLTKANLVWGTKAIILDWSGEYLPWVHQCGGTVVRLGQESLNILDLGGMTPFQRIQQVIHALSLLAEIKDPIHKQWLQLALENVYSRHGFSLSKSSSRQPPTLKEVLAWLQRRQRKTPVEELALLLRFLCQKGNDFFAKRSTLNLSDFFEKPLVCIDLTSLPSESFRSLAGLTLLQWVRERMRQSDVHNQRRLDRLVVLDEAWKICLEEGEPSVIVREGRKHAFGLIVATQNPQDVSKTIFSNVGTLFIFRTLFSEALDHLQASVAFSNEMRARLAGLPVGECAVNLLWEKGRSPAFFLQRVEGEELLKSCALEVNDMVWQMEKTLLLQYLQSLGVPSQETDSWLASRGYKADLALFCLFLEQKGIPEKSQCFFLKKVGLNETQIRNVLLAKRQKAAPNGMRWAKVVADETRSGQ